MQVAARLFNRIARSHMYWGRKPLVGLLQLLEDVSGGVVLDPFCGAGTPAIAALVKGARVVATDLNPMAAFLTRVLVRPLSIPLLHATFDRVRSSLEDPAADAYAMVCHQCKKPATADFLLWNGPPEQGSPVAAKVHCQSCGKLQIKALDSGEQVRQTRLSQMQPAHPYPQSAIHTVSRHPPVPTHDLLFTQRNLALLANLLAAINDVESVPYREALQYVFTASLYSCSRMQMFSQKDPSSSRGWTAVRFYIPPHRKETNVLHAFSRRFESFLSCKEQLNAAVPTVRVTNRMNSFNQGTADIIVRQMRWADSLKHFGHAATHAFLDPPYNEDVDYFGFSEFWGTWLGMRFPFRAEWHPRRTKGTFTEKLLTCVANSTSPKCRVTLALDPKHPAGWETETAINSSGYQIAATGCFLYDNSYKRGEDLLRRRDRYYVLERLSRKRSASRKKIHAAKKQLAPNADAYPYLRAMAHLLAKESPGPETLRARTSDILPPHLRHLSDKLEGPEIQAECADTDRNRRTYQALCLAFVALLLQRDGWTLRQTQKTEVEQEVFGLCKPVASRSPAESAVAVFGSRDVKRKLLVFFPEQGSSVLKASAARIAKNDKGSFRRIAVLITRSREEMQEWRALTKANRWRRGFFLSMDELRRRCAEACPDNHNRICSSFAESPMTRALRKGANGHGISAFSARILKNVQVGGKEAPYHKLRFKASVLTGIVPGQFIMMDTAPRVPLNGVRAVGWQEFKASFPEAPQTYLKRPFGVHRAYYPHFPSDYLRRLRLPRSLATVMHTALPNTFDVFYKLLPHGKGTREMQGLRKGVTVEMLGPLGIRFDIRKMVDQDVSEVHVIGGGVGMAPLIFLVQSLRYFNVPVKAFIGIESIAILRYREKAKPHPAQGDHIDEGYAAGSKDAHIYVDDLKQAGVDCKSIFVSYDKGGKVGNVVPPGNHARGLVSDLYGRYLAGQPLDKPVIAFACGPMPMMKAVFDIAKARRVQVHVLMEKRMACGIGVCLSCVCRTTTARSGYSRVCKEGPVFDANEIVWP